MRIRRKATKGCFFAHSNAVLFTEITGSPGTIALSGGNQFPLNAVPDEITSTTNASGIPDEPFLIWMKKEEGGNWQIIDGADGQNYQPTALNATTSFSRGMNCSANLGNPDTNPSAFSNTVTMTVLPSTGAIYGHVRSDASNVDSGIDGLTIRVEQLDNLPGRPAGFIYEVITMTDPNNTWPGVYDLGNIYCGLSGSNFRVTPIGTDFDPKTVFLNNNSSQMVTFSPPLGTVTVSGRITQTYDGVECGMAGITVKEIDCSLCSMIETSEDGTFVFTFSQPPGGLTSYANFAPSAAGYTFSPPESGNIYFSSQDVTGVDFSTSTTMDINGYVVADCDTYLGLAKVHIYDDCFSTEVWTDNTGYFEVLDFPARSYTVEVTDIANPVSGFDEVQIENYFQSQNYSIDFDGSNPTLDFIYPSDDTDGDNLSNTCDNCPTTPSRGLDFDGVNDYLEMDTELGNFGMSDFTIEFWIKTSTTPVNNNIMLLVSKRDNCACEKLWDLYMRDDGTLTWTALQTTDCDPSLRTTLLGNTSIADGEWHHIAAVRDASTFSFYIDGVLDASVAITNRIDFNTSSHFRVSKTGCTSAPWNQQFFRGKMDELRVWTTARSPEEINAALATEIDPNSPNLVAYYDFNEGVPQENNQSWPVVLDKTPNDNKSTLYNFTKNFLVSNWTVGAPVASIDNNLDAIGDLCQMPANDHPCAATPLAVDGTLTYYENLWSTVNHGEQLIVPSTEVCSDWCDASILSSVWFTFTAPASGKVEISLCVETDFDSQIAVYEATNCADFTSFSLVAYNDDHCSLRSYLSIQGLIPGETYYALVDGYIANRGTFSIGVNEFIPLPLESIALLGKTTATDNLLEWTTIGEKDIQTYWIERSLDGKDFTTLGEVEAMANTTGTNTYHWTDKQPLSFAYYQIKALDEAGKDYLSNVISLARNNKEDFLWQSLYPNPATDELFIDFSLDTAQSIEIELMDITGRTIIAQQLEGRIGENQERFDVAGLSAGTYFVRLVRANGDFEVRKLVVQ